MNKNVIKTKQPSPCKRCQGNGSVNGTTCKRCEGTGKYTETYYYFTNGKIAFGGDTLK